MPTEPPAAEPARIGAWTLSAAALLGAVGLAAIWAPPVVPGLDTPHHLVSAWIAAHPAAYQGWFESNWPRALLVHRALLQAAFHVASPFAALKLARTVELFSMGLGALVLARRVGASGLVVVALAIAGCFGWFHMMGYLNFMLAAALVPWALACLRERPTRREGVLLAAITLLITETHPFVGAGLAAILVVSALCHRFVDPPTATEASWIPLLAGVPSLAAVALSLGPAVRGQPAVEALAARSTTLAQDLTALPQNVFGGYSPLGAPLAALAVSAAVLWLWSERRARTVRWWVGALSLASIVGYFVAPMDGLGWVFLKPRFALFPFLVAALPARLPPRLARGLGAAAVGLAAAHIALFGMRSVEAGRRTAETIASFGHEAPGVMLPIVFDGRDGQEPADNLGTLTYSYAYALLNGPGAAPLLFAQNPILHHILLSPDVRTRVPEHPSPWAYRSLLRGDPATAALRRMKLADKAAMNACDVDSVVLVGASDADRARLEARGIRFSAPGFGRPSCARGSVRFERARHVPVRVRIGLAETDAWALDGTLDPKSDDVEAVLPAGELDVVVCPDGVAVCTPAHGAMVHERLTVSPAGKLAELVRVP